MNLEIRQVFVTGLEKNQQEYSEKTLSLCPVLEGVYLFAWTAQEVSHEYNNVFSNRTD